jgi:succinoglycan biosynthesis transport protein ExoP
MSRSNPSHLPARVGTVLPVADSLRESLGNLGGDGGAPPESGTDWRRVRSAIWRFKWLVVALPLLAAAGGYGASRFVKPVYRARATVWINKQAEATNTQLQPGAQFGTEAWIDLFRSYTVIDRAVSDRHLSLSVQPFDSLLTSSFTGFDERFTPGSYTITIDSVGQNFVLRSASGVVVERGAVGGPVGAALGYKWTPPAASLPAGKTIAFLVLSPRQAALNLLDRLHVTIDGTGTFLHAELTGDNPTRTSQTLNAIVQNFERVAADMKSAGLADRTRILDRQMKSAQGDLAAAETALEQFRLQSITRSNARPTAPRQPGPGEPAAADPEAALYFSMRAEMDSAVRETRAIRRALAESADSGLVVGELEHVPSVVASSELSAALKELTTKRADLHALQLKLTDSHPLVVKARAELSTLERVEIPALANRVLSMLATREAELAASATSTAKDLQNAPALAATEARLQRNVTLAEGLYSQLQPRFAEAQLAEGSAVPDVKALDRAEAPQFADMVITKKLVLVSFLAGLGLALAAALQLDRMDAKFRYPDQVTRELGLPILGAVPHLTTKGKSGARVDEGAAFREALRDIRMNVAYAYGIASPLVLTVSSAGPADGKSFIAANLARTFAESGHRTLLVDADLRRGELHRRFGVSRKPGLTDCLNGDVDVERIIQQTKFAKLDLVTSGTRKHNAPELLGSPATAPLFGEFRSRYDVIICDSPPLSAGVDPFLLSALSGSLLVVVRTGVSVREVIESKLSVLARMPVRILGAVLNDVPRSAAYGYYASYVPGYDTSDETGAALQRIIV